MFIKKNSFIKPFQAIEPKKPNQLMQQCNFLNNYKLLETQRRMCYKHHLH